VPEKFCGILPQAFIVMGVSGSGKSTLGAELANTLGCSFLDGDSFHTAQAIAKMRSGEPLTDDDRWPWLDSLAAAIDAEVITRGATVAACSALRRAYRDRLRQTIKASVCFVLLDGERQELLRRLSNRPGHYMPPSLLSSQLETLERPTPDESVLTLDASLTTTALRDRVLAQLDRDHSPK
jgi:gluconokinase